MNIYRLNTNNYFYETKRLFLTIDVAIKYLTEMFGENNVKYSENLNTIHVNDIENKEDVFFTLKVVEVME